VRRFIEGNQQMRTLRRSTRATAGVAVSCLTAVIGLASAGPAAARPAASGLAAVAATGRASAGHAASRVTGDRRVGRLLSEMTLDEKLTLLEGAQEAASTNQFTAGYLPGIPRLGIPSLRLADGPPGVATRQPSVGMTGTMGVAAAFSQRDAYLNGVVIGRDARALGVDVVLEPFVNIDRDPAWGRAFNTFGEDPLLTGQTGAAEISGIQGQGTMAMVKHFIAYDGGNNVVVDSQTLHEIYLEPFADAIDAGVASVMCSYNTLNVVPATPSTGGTQGPYSCGNSATLTGILRGELGFQGFVTSDWGANKATSFINDGLDMEMPGTGFGDILPTYFSAADLKAGIAAGTVSMATIDAAVGHILYEMDRFGLLNGYSKHNVTPEPVNADEQVVQQTAQDAATLLKNDTAALPLSSADLSNLALIGPGAGQTIAVGQAGENASGIVSQQTGTYQVLQQMLRHDRSAHLTYAVGDDMTGTPVPATALSYNGQPGLLLTNTSTGTTSVVPQLDNTTSNGQALPAGSAWTWTGDLNVPVSGSYWINLGLLGAGGSIRLDGTQIARTGFINGTAPRYGVLRPGDNNVLPTTDGLDNLRTQLNLTAGQHTLAVTISADVSGDPVQARLNWVTPAQQQANTDAAVAAARQAKTAVVFAWSTGSLATPLPEGQDQLIADVAAANPNTIVVLNTSDPVAMPWLGSVKAVLEMWYPGDTGGYATANVLLGRTDPAGRLPFTWPAALGQGVANQPATHPERTSNGVDANGNYCTNPGPGGPFGGPCTTTYTEGIYEGYRWYDQQNETPLYPFGYGLSYTHFSYSGLHWAPAWGGGVDVVFRVTNTGSVTGDEVPQVYLGPPASPPAGVAFADRALAAYSRITLRPGQSQLVWLNVPLRQLQYWNTQAGQWVTATGQRPLYIGSNERSPELATSISR
jgi:beta-glucosidase